MAKKTITISQDVFNEHTAVPYPSVERFALGTAKMQAVMEPAIKAMEKVFQALKKGTAKDAQTAINYLSLWHNYVRYGASEKTLEKLDDWKLEALPKVAAWWSEQYQQKAPHEAAKVGAKKAPAKKKARKKK